MMLKDRAIELGRHNYPVFLLQPNGKIPLISKDDGGNGCLDATTDVAEIDRMWSEHPTANVGIRTGDNNVNACTGDGDTVSRISQGNTVYGIGKTTGSCATEGLSHIYLGTV